jgi:hypothetical protein
MPDKPVTDINKLRGFAQRIMESWPTGDVDGADLQEAALEFELLVDVEVMAPCGDACMCADCGSDFPTRCYRKTALLTNASGTMPEAK